MERYIGCMLCGVARTAAKHLRCADEKDVVMAAGHEEHTHLWTEMVLVPQSFYGKGIVEDVDKLGNN